jgi:hypothetical protein
MLRERASDEATILMSPRISLQGYRFPQNGQLSGGVISGQGYQPRAELSFSVTDFYKGLQVPGLGDADCRAHDARVGFEGALGSGDDEARHVGLQALVAYLDAHHAEVNAWVDKAAERFAQRVITLIEWNDMRAGADALERKRAQAYGQVKQLEAKRVSQVGTELPADLAREYIDSAAQAARAEARVRWTDPWQLRVAAGVIPLSPLDWYGVVELGFNLGGVARPGHAARYVQARQDELEHAPYEAMARLRQYHEMLAAARDGATAELAIVEHDLESVTSASRALESADAPNITHQRERLALEEISLQADGVYLRAYAEALNAVLAKL